jgi:hypothetical protein
MFIIVLVVVVMGDLIDGGRCISLTAILVDDILSDGLI